MTKVASDDARIAELTRELDDLHSRQQAIAEILRALSRSRMRLQPILDQIVEAAARLCRSDGCFLHLVDDGLLHIRASFGAPPEAVEYERLHPEAPGPGSLTGRVALTKKPVHIPDVSADPEYTFPATDLGRYDTLLGLPVLVEDELVGVIGSHDETASARSKRRNRAHGDVRRPERDRDRHCGAVRDRRATEN